MIAHVIGCGSTALNWNGEGFSIGCNDCWRFGHPTNHLLLINSPSVFAPDRLKIIQDSCPDVFWSHVKSWEKRPDYKFIGPMVAFHKRFTPGHIYFSNSSPFTAVTLAYKLGYRQFILWGVDFMNHKSINQENGTLHKALSDFHFLQEGLLKNGASMHLGSKGSALDLPIWK
jgi:hypothetical protein